MRLAYWLLPLAFLLLIGCSDNGHDNLNQYLADIKSQPTGTVEPLPTFKHYELFEYAASHLRSPFESPRKKEEQKPLSSNMQPDSNRAKGYLEQFDIATLSMVGSISNDTGIWGLVRGEGGIHRVQVGDYLGRNHGRITHIGAEAIQLLEIVPVGPAMWIEKERKLLLRDSQRHSQ